MKKILLLSAIILHSILSFSQQSSHVVISEIYTGDTGSPSIYKNQFIELYNPTEAAVNLLGWSLQCWGETGWQVIPLTGTIPGAGYYLVKCAENVTGINNLPTPDDNTTISIFNKVLLTKTLEAQTGDNPDNLYIIDKVGFGDATGFEGVAIPFVTYNNNDNSYERKAYFNSTEEQMDNLGIGNGYDTNNNQNDFIIRTKPGPQNIASNKEGAYPIDLGILEIRAISPINNYLAMPINYKPTVTFHNSVGKGIGFIKVKNITDGTIQNIDVQSPEVVINYAIVTIGDIMLKPGNTYAIQMDKDAFGGNTTPLDFYGINDYDTWKFTVEGVMPIQLSSFNVFGNGNKVDLSFTTSSEKNNAFFTIEHSTDGIKFCNIKTIAGAGNSDSENNYATSHFSPSTGVNYYRLSQTDYNGVNTILSTKLLKLITGVVNNLSVYPIPANDRVTIATGLNQVSNIELFNLNGVLVKALQTNGSGVANADVSNLPVGVYILQTSQNNKMVTSKVIISR